MTTEVNRVSRSRQSSISVSKNVVQDKQGEDREELDFQFDEELDRPLPAVKQNTFTEWSDSDESEYDEVGDDFINKVLFHRLIIASTIFIKLTFCFLDSDCNSKYTSFKA